MPTDTSRTLEIERAPRWLRGVGRALAPRSLRYRVGCEDRLRSAAADQSGLRERLAIATGVVVQRLWRLPDAAPPDH